MNINLEDSGWWVLISTVAVSFFTGMTFWIAWGFRKSFITRDEFNVSESKIIRLETRVDNLPTTEDLEPIRIQLAVMKSQIDGFIDVINRMDQRISIMYEHHIQRDIKNS